MIHALHCTLVLLKSGLIPPGSIIELHTKGRAIAVISRPDLRIESYKPITQGPPQ